MMPRNRTGWLQRTLRVAERRRPEVHPATGATALCRRGMPAARPAPCLRSPREAIREEHRSHGVHAVEGSVDGGNCAGFEVGRCGRKAAPSGQRAGARTAAASRAGVASTARWLPSCGCTSQNDSCEASRQSMLPYRDGHESHGAASDHAARGPPTMARSRSGGAA